VSSCPGEMSSCSGEMSWASGDLPWSPENCPCAVERCPVCHEGGRVAQKNGPVCHDDGGVTHEGCPVVHQTGRRSPKRGPSPSAGAPVWFSYGRGLPENRPSLAEKAPASGQSLTKHAQDGARLPQRGVRTRGSPMAGRCAARVTATSSRRLGEGQRPAAAAIPLSRCPIPCGNSLWTWRSAVQGLRPYAVDGRYPVKRYFIGNR
jgi:hypothetical protein